MSERKYRQRGYQDSAPTEPRSGSGPSTERPQRLEGAPHGRGAERNREEVFRCRACGERNDPEVAPQAVCRKCGAALHACSQCRHFDSGARFQCRQPVPVPIQAKSRANDCSFYATATALDLTGKKAAETPDQARAAFDRLFGKR